MLLLNHHQLFDALFLLPKGFLMTIIETHPLAFQAWFNRAQIIAKAPLTLQKGKKYLRIIKDHYAFCFIDQNGKVLKAASWKTPAKHPRGNIFVVGEEGISEYGGIYLI
jgi:hypothetical protein